MQGAGTRPEIVARQQPERWSQQSHEPSFPQLDNDDSHPDYADASYAKLHKTPTQPSCLPSSEMDSSALHNDVSKKGSRDSKGKHRSETDSTIQQPQSPGHPTQMEQSQAEAVATDSYARRALERY